MADSINIVLCDHHTFFRRTIHRLLDSIPAFEVIGEATDGEEAVRLVRNLQPTVAILETDMPKLHGIEATRQMTELAAPPKVIILTMLSTRDLVFRAFEAGCVAFVHKAYVADELIEAIHEAVAERWFLSEQIRLLQPELEERFAG